MGEMVEEAAHESEISNLNLVDHVEDLFILTLAPDGTKNAFRNVY